MHPPPPKTAHASAFAKQLSKVPRRCLGPGVCNPRGRGSLTNNPVDSLPFFRPNRARCSPLSMLTIVAPSRGLRWGADLIHQQIYSTTGLANTTFSQRRATCFFSWARTREYWDRTNGYLKLVRFASDPDVRGRLIVIARHYRSLAEAEERIAEQVGIKRRSVRNLH